MKSITLKVVGYYSFITRKVYNTKDELTAAETPVKKSISTRIKVAMFKGIALADKLKEAKKALKVFGHQFFAWSYYWTVKKQVEAFNLITPKYLRVYGN